MEFISVILMSSRLPAMKKVIGTALCILGILSASIFSSGCSDSIPAPKEGKYVNARGGADSYITLSGYKTSSNSSFGDQYVGECYLQFHDIDLKTYADFCINITVTNYIAINITDEMTQEEYDAKYDELYKEFIKNIDLKAQYSDKSSLFYYGHSTEYNNYWFSSEIAGSGFDGKYEGYLNVEYLPDEKAIICDDIKYVLEE